MRLLAPCLCAAALACAAAPEATFAPSSAPLTATNGDNLNGDNLNGDNLNGDNLNGLGFHVAAVSYAGAQYEGGVFDQVWIEGSELVGQKGSSIRRGAATVHDVFQGTTDTGAAVDLRIESAWSDPAPNDDTWNYLVSYYDATLLSWRPLCKDAQGNAIPALAIDGTWSQARGVPGGGAKTRDGSAFTFACKMVGAVGKCAAVVGYRPWRTLNGVSLDRHHQACVRLLRADFCGDGTPYTQNGNRVNVYDGIGVQQDTEAWFIEAEWDENGARCFYPLNRSRSAVPCFDDRATTACGSPSNFSAGALLMDETPTLGLTP